MKKKTEQYTLDELGELIVPHRLTDKESKQISAAIKEDKERNKLKKATLFKLKIPSVFSEVKKTEQIFSLDDLLEQIGPRPITKTDERIFSEAIRKYKKAHSTLSDKKKSSSLSNRKSYTNSTSEVTFVSEPKITYRKTKR